MYTIKLLNNTSDKIYEELPAAQYRVSQEAEAPDAIIVRSASMHDMQPPQSLLAVARAGAGVNNIPVEDYARQGIAVFNTPGANANAVAELVLLGMLLSGRKVIEGIEWARTLKGQADVPKLVEKGKGQFVGPELRGKTLGVVGLGAIGALVANAAARGLGMRVLGEDPFISVQSAWQLSTQIQRSSLEEILQQSDFVSLHVPLGADTRGMVDAAMIARMKPGAHLLNFSRAELVDGAAVRDALQSGQLSTYVVDFPTDDMIGVKGVICIPHLGASTPESEENCAVMAASQLRDYLESGSIRNSVNLPDMQLGAPQGVRIQVVHANEPGVVTAITSGLCESGVNINSMASNSRGGVGVTTLDLSAAPTQAQIDALVALPRVIRVRVVCGA